MSTRAFQLLALRCGIERKIRAEKLRRIPDALRIVRLRRVSELLRRRMSRLAAA